MIKQCLNQIYPKKWEKCCTSTCPNHIFGGIEMSLKHPFGLGLKMRHPKPKLITIVSTVFPRTNDFLNWHFPTLFKPYAPKT